MVLGKILLVLAMLVGPFSTFSQLDECCDTIIWTGGGSGNCGSSFVQLYCSCIPAETSYYDVSTTICLVGDTVEVTQDVFCYI
jgi:hypothetical protein